MSDITLRQAMERVRKFHEKHGFPVNSGVPTGFCPDLVRIGTDLIDWARKIQDKARSHQLRGDERLWRAMLAVEELGEWLLALSDSREDDMADAAADRLFILLGDCVTADLPIQELFLEIAYSNNTKAVRNPDEPRMRDKGPLYEPPAIQAALAAGRRRDVWERSLKEGVS